MRCCQVANHKARHRPTRWLDRLRTSAGGIVGLYCKKCAFFMTVSPKAASGVIGRLLGSLGICDAPSPTDSPAEAPECRFPI